MLQNLLYILQFIIRALLLMKTQTVLKEIMLKKLRPCNGMSKN